MNAAEAATALPRLFAFTAGTVLVKSEAETVVASFVSKVLRERLLSDTMATFAAIIVG